MFYRIFPLFMLLLAVEAAAQTPMHIQLEKNAKLDAFANKNLACADQFAGTISFNSFLGQSNDIDLDTIYFCFNDEISITHNPDANLSGDPVPVTLPGITYAYLNCPPTISGPNLTSILLDPCIIDNPMPINDLWITGGGQPNGNITFSNTGVSQNIFNMGDPVLLWFAPITIDRFPNIYEADPTTGETGPCTHMNIAEAFAVVYLNEITTSNTQTNTGLSGCQGSFEVEGGLPEFDGSNYTFDITLIGNNSVKGTVVSGPATHGATVEFQVPVPGVYLISVEDGKSCGATLFANMSSCVSVTQSVQSLSAAPGDLVCLDVTNENGFNNIAGMNYGLTWDESVLQFASVTNLTTLLPSFSPATSFNSSLGDTLVFAWFNPSGTGVNLPVNTVIYQVCFNVIGGNGNCTDVSYVSPSSNGIDVVTANGSQLGFNGIDGSVCVSNSALVIDFTQTAVTCPSGTNGSFSVTVNGGNAPYQITWQNTTGGPIGGPGVINLNGGSFTANNLAAGTYSVTVNDGQGTPLVGVEQVTVPGPPPLVINFLVNRPTCNDLSDGSLIANLISGGQPVSNPLNTYTFAWSVPGNGNVSAIGSLPVGTYTVTVTNNSNGCSLSNTVQMTQPDPISLQIAENSATCTGIPNGSLSVMVSGGTPNANQDYTIEWPSVGAGITVVGTSSSLSGLEANCYPLVVTDNNGCELTQDVCVTADKVLSFNAVVTPIGCSSACSGGIFATAFTTGGVPSTQFNFDWFGVPVPPPPVAEGNNFSEMDGLCEGTITMILETSDGCRLDTTFQMAPASELDLNLLTFQNVSCMPGNNGSITVEPSGGNAPYTYNWSNGSTTNTPMLTGLSAGTYDVTVVDGGGCRDSVLNITLVSPLGPNITLLADDVVSCSNSTDGILTVTAMPGNTPITGYTWSNGMMGQAINNLAPGTYIVTVSDAAGCMDVDTAMVLASSQIVIDSFVTSAPQCPGLGGGNIIAFISGGTTPYFFNWSNGLTGNGLNANNNLVAGNYALTVSDANGCPPATGSVTISDPPSILADFTAIDSVSCANGGQTCDGTATATASYSDNSAGLFNFIWISGTTNNNTATSIASNLCAGNQRLIISDGICFDTFFVNIPAPPIITPGQDIENVSCNGLSDGEITLEPSGGTPPYTIIWQNGTPGNSLTDLPAGSYTAAITDSKNCTFTHMVTVTEPSVFEVFLNPNVTANLSCPGVPDGTIAVVAQGGNVGELVYLWQNNVAGTDEATATGLPAGTYSVTVTDPEGCSDSLTHTLAEPPPIQFVLGETAPIECFGEITTITVESVTGGNPNANYVFSSGACIQIELGEPCPILAGEHEIEILDLFNGCSLDTTVNVEQPQQITVTLPEIVEIELGDTLTRLDPTIVSSFPIDTFIWSPAENLSCYDCKNPRVIGIEPTDYTLTITDINGCTATAEVFVDIDRNRNVYVPNVFSPNGDGINDKFQVFTGIGVERINYLRVYDRWGELVYDEKDLPPSPDGALGWDGIFRGNVMNPGVFIYAVEVRFIDGKVLVYRGDAILVR